MKATTATALPVTLINEMKSLSVWQAFSPVALNRLCLVTIPYVDFSGNEHDDGQMVVLDAVADKVVNVFSALAQKRFPINKIRSMHHYKGDDKLSMEDNNSSSYCCRPVQGSTLISLHAYGLAIDINPLQNPFVEFKNDKEIISPSGGLEFMNRHNQKPGMVEDIVELMSEQGFLVWGGHWTSPIDYHHFQVHRGTAELLSVLTLEDGKRFVDATIQERHRLNKSTALPCGEKLQPLIDLYKSDKERFFASWTNYIS